MVFPMSAIVTESCVRTPVTLLSLIVLLPDMSKLTHVLLILFRSIVTVLEYFALVPYPKGEIEIWFPKISTWLEYDTDTARPMLPEIVLDKIETWAEFVMVTAD